MESKIQLSEDVQEALAKASDKAISLRNEFITPEHFLQGLIWSEKMLDALEYLNVDVDEVDRLLTDYISELERVPDNHKYDTPTISSFLIGIMEYAANAAEFSGIEVIDVEHCINAMAQCKGCYATSLIEEICNNDIGTLISLMIAREESEENEDIDYSEVMSLGSDGQERKTKGEGETKQAGDKKWLEYVTCLNDTAEDRNPLIGREKELRRTIQVLCRKDKNNPLHVGEPGVGKTALVYGLARLINEGKVPLRLQGSKIYSLDLGTLLAGTKYRGDFEKRIKDIMKGLSEEQSPILYIDEIHNLVGAGAVGESSMDASNMLKKYLETGEIRFIGSTTYEEYNRYFSKSKGLMRRFEQIDVKEPDREDAIEILRQLKGRYEDFHNVSYTEDALVYAVEGSMRHITERYLPDKAIDLLDESGAERAISSGADDKERKSVDKNDVLRALSMMCRREITEIGNDDPSADLATLGNRIKAKVFGQDEAVEKTVESILMSKAGLVDEDKPVASLLFVGPTGVGKTEIAKVLAQESGMPLLRFDMSEYSEKHSVAKFIGSPAGYVGYEDGGILTDAIRKNPSCVLLLDEIEKAHPDIFDTLLQVMDYARLTDNKGRHSDFRNVILVMTSNAGAQYASRSKVGFASSSTAGGAMLAQVKRMFKPEFINRLSATVVFNDMTEDMASLILDKKLKSLGSQLAKRDVGFTLSEEARKHILEKGFSKEYGGRELDRVLSAELKPLLMKAILFGSLKKGGEAEIAVEEGKLAIG